MIKNMKIRFNLDKENDRKAYDYLQGADHSYSKAVISAICEYLELSERTATEDAFLERVIATIKEELAKANPFGLLQLVQTPPAQISTEKENKAETEETVMDFMDNF
jgi:ribosomal protein S12 methylthiotransferase accessory factor YcaO